MTTISLTLDHLQGPVISVEAADRTCFDLITRLPLPFTIVDRVTQADWHVQFLSGSLGESWPDKQRTLATYRPGGMDPFPWILEVMNPEYCLVWMSDENSGERAKMEVYRMAKEVNIIQEHPNYRWLIRVLKNIFSAQLLSDGWIPLHASAFLSDEKIVICSGERGNGKSSLAFLAAIQKNAAYLADDIVLIRPSSHDNWDVLGWPGRLAVRIELLNQVLGPDKVLSLQKKLRRGIAGDPNHPRGVRLAFDPDEFSELLNIDFLGSAKGSIRVLQLQTLANSFPTINWTNVHLNSALEAQGFNRRYLVDALGLFTGGQYKPASQRLDAYCVPIKTSDLLLPYDISGVLNSIWRKILES